MEFIPLLLLDTIVGSYYVNHTYDKNSCLFWVLLNRTQNKTFHATQINGVSVHEESKTHNLERPNLQKHVIRSSNNNHCCFVTRRPERGSLSSSENCTLPHVCPLLYIPITIPFTIQNSTRIPFVCVWWWWLYVTATNYKFFRFAQGRAHSHRSRKQWKWQHEPDGMEPRLK
jgi:hypothetical protein